MKCYKLKITFILNSDINYKEISQKVAYSIQKSMYRQEELKQLHDSKNYKYIFSPLVPFVKKEIYEKGEIYSIFIQSFDEKTIVKFNYSLNNFRDNNISVKTIKLIENRMDDMIIEEIEAITPVIITVEGKPWIHTEHSIDILMQKIYDNLEKKYVDFFGQTWDLKDEFSKYSLLENITILSNKPISRKYKNINLIGYKIKINVGTNPIAQCLAKVAIVQGLGEKNSILGSGYVKYKCIKG